MRRSLPLARYEEVQPLPVARMLRLALEILATYGSLRLKLVGRQTAEVVQCVRVGAPSATASLPPGTQERLADAVARVLSPLPSDSRCLIRSLVLFALLARRGVEATVVIGVKTAPEFGAHAWVEREGRPLLPTGGGEFEPLAVL